MERFLNWLLARPDSKRDHSAADSMPDVLAYRITRLRQDVKRGGRNSDLATAELRGITTTIMALGRAR